MNMFVVRLVLLLFLSSAALVRRAQNEFYKNDGQNPLRGLFQFEGGNVANSKGSFDDGNIQKVIGILQNNIKQWSFIESQLLEPNVNLGMPEIFIPLKHLTTTLEILGNIFFVQNDLAAAKSSLERACPLMELLPASLLTDEDFSAAAGEVLGDHGLRLDPADISSYLWMGGGDARALEVRGTGADGSSTSSEGGASYAAGCFSLLRDVYAKLYRDTLPPPLLDGESGDSASEPSIKSTDSVSTNTLTSGSDSTSKSNSHIPSPQHQHPQQGFSSSNLKYSSHQGGYSSYLLPNGKPREFNLKYLLSKRQQRQQMKQRALYSRHNASLSLSRGRGTSSSSESHQAEDVNSGGSLSPLGLGPNKGPRSTKVSGAKLSMTAATLGSAYLEKSAAAAQLEQLQQQNKDKAKDNEKESNGEDHGHRRRDHDLLQGADGDFLYDHSETSNSGGNQDKDKKDTKDKPSGASSPATPRRTSVFSGADEEEVELSALSSPVPPATTAPAKTDSARQPSPLRGPSHADKRRQQQLELNGFDLEQKLRELRSPYEHLRSELLERGQGGQGSQHPAKRPTSATPSLRDDPTSSSSSSSSAPDVESTEEENEEVRGGGEGGGRRVGLGLSSSSGRGKKHKSQSPQGQRDTNKPGVRGFEGSSLNSISGEDITAPGVSTSVIADDLEVLLRKFVQADKRARRELLVLARKYYDELDINFPNMDYNEYAANMDVGQAYLEVMGRAAEEGFGFVNTELDSWKASAAEAQRQTAAAEAASSKAGKDKGKAGAGAGKKGAEATKAKGKPAPATKGAKKDSLAPSASAPPLQVTMAEKNRLLVLYAFDIVHTDPSDPFDLGLGFNRGIVDNDRSRRGDHFMADALNDAVASLGLDSTLAGLLGAAGSDDAHKRLFPQDGSGAGSSSSSASSGGVTEQLTEQHLRNLLSEGGGEEYLAARSSAAKSKAAKSRRRKQRQQQMEGGGEYSREDGDAIHRSGGAGSGPGGYFSSGQDRDGAGDLFDDDVLGASLRSSVPSIEGDWTLSLFVLFMLLTGAVVYSAYQEAARKKVAARPRARMGGGAGASKKGASSLLTGSGLVDFMYAQINGTPAADEADADSSGHGTGDDARNGGASSGPLRQLSSLLFPKTDAAIAANGKPATPNGGTPNGTSGTSKSKKSAAKESAALAAAAAQQQQQHSAPAEAVGASSSLLGDLLSFIPSTTAAIRGTGGSTAPAAESAQSGGSKNSDTTKHRDNTVPAKNGDAGASDAASEPSGKGGRDRDTAKEKGEGKDSAHSNVNGSTAATSSTASTAKAGKGKKNNKDKDKETHKASTSSASSAASATATATTTVPAGKLVASTSNNSLHTSGSGSSGDESTDSSSFAHPVTVTMGNRRVSWAGLLPGATTSTQDAAAGFSGGADSAEQGDWAEARKKGSKRSNAASGGNAGAGAGEEKEGNGSGNGGVGANGAGAKLGLKDSPLYRQQGPNQRPQPAPFSQQQQQQQQQRPLPAANGAGAGAAADASRKPFTSRGAGLYVPPPMQNHPDSAHAQAQAPYSRAAAGGSTSGASAVQNRAGGSGKMYDLSEAKRMAEQMGGWQGSTPASAPTASTAATSVSTAGSTKPSAGSAPPGLLPVRNGTSGTPSLSPSNASTLASPHTVRSPSSATASSSQHQFGFSQLDLGLSSAAYLSGPSVSTSAGGGGVWGGAGLHASSNPSLASLAASLSATSNNGSGKGNGKGNSALAAQSAAYGGGKESSRDGGNAYLGDLVSYLDSSTSISGRQYSTTSSAASAASLYGDPYRSQGGASLYGSAADGSNTATDGSGAGLSAEYDALDDGYFHVPSASSATGTAQDLYYHQQYGQYGDSQQHLYGEEGYYGYAEDQQHHYEDQGGSYSEPARWDHGGLRQAPLVQPTAEFAASITLEASSLYGLSPDAPSFRPSQHRSTTAANSGGTSGGTSGTASGGAGGFGAFSSRYEPLTSSFGGNNSVASGDAGGAGLGLFGDSLLRPTLLRPSASSVTSGMSTSASASATGASALTSAHALFHSDDFYESILIDSILGGEDPDPDPEHDFLRTADLSSSP